MIKYYDRKLQEYANAEDVTPKEHSRIDARSRKLYCSYRTQLKKLQTRLGERNYKLFSARPDPVFDSNLLHCSYGDRKGRGLRFYTEAAVHLLDFDVDQMYSFQYSGVREFKADLPKRRWFRGDDCGCLLWHEITASTKTHLRHEFLFTSGATISIEFEKLSWKKRRVTNYRDSIRLMVQSK